MEINPTNSEIAYLHRKLLQWGRENYQDFPWRSLNNRWYSLVAEIMLQRTRAEQVEPIFVEFTEKYPQPSDYLRDTQSDVFEHLGLPQRRDWLKALADEIDKNGIAENRDEVLALPGIGDYIASAFRSLHLNIRDRIIDSNVVRFYGRFFGFKTDGETRRKKWFINLAETLTPVRVHRDYNYALLDFTRKICKPSPDCPACPLRRKCHYDRLPDERP